MNITELRSAVDTLRSEIDELSSLDDITPEQDARLDEAIAEHEARKVELDRAEAREAKVAEIRGQVAAKVAVVDKGAPNFIRPVDVYDYDLRALPNIGSELRDRVMRVLDDDVTKAVPDKYRAARLEGIERSVFSVDHEAVSPSRQNAGHAQHFLATMRPEYIRGYAKLMTGSHDISSDERRALDEARAWSVGSDSTVIPELFDPTVGITNAGNIDPIRQLATIKTGTADVWEGLHSGGVTASWDGEAVEVSDDDPAFTRPTITAYKAAIFVPFSVEFQGDAPAVVAEIGAMFADAKARLEGTAFATGSGSATTGPKGVITALDATTYAEVTPTTDGAFGVEDLYKVMNALSPRFRGNATWVASMNVTNRIRAFGTALGHAYSGDLNANYGFTPLGKPLYEDSDYPAPTTLTTGAQNLLTFGDHSKYYIYDRVGLATEFIPHIFSTNAGRPTGQRGIYGWWRVGGDFYFTGTTPPVLLLQNQ